jgi:hypothetical protein
LQKEEQDSIYRVVQDYIPNTVRATKNKAKSWVYGYDEKYDFIVISKDGTVGDIVDIQGLKIGLPLAPRLCPQRHKKPEEQYWERMPIPKELSRIQSIFQWNEKPSQFRDRWVDYIEEEFDYRERGLLVYE